MNDAKDSIIDAAIETFEVELDKDTISFLGAFFGPNVQNVLKEVPILKWGYALAAVVNAGSGAMKARRLIAFYKALKSGKNASQYMRGLSPKDSQRLRELVLEQIDKQTHEKQSEALGKLLDALVEGQISASEFEGVAAELMRVNPLAYQTSKLYDFRKIKAGTIITGPLHYLPAAFHSVQAEGLQFSTMFFLTNLGEIFFEHVYKAEVDNEEDK